MRLSRHDFSVNLSQIHGTPVVSYNKLAYKRLINSAYFVLHIENNCVHSALEIAWVTNMAHKFSHSMGYASIYKRLL